MIGLSSALAPSIRVGLQVGVGPAALWLNGVVSSLTASIVFLPAGSTSYIYLNTTTGLLGVNQTGFSTSNIPIATVTTGLSGITNLVDNRPDFTNVGSGGTSLNFANAEIPGGAINGVNKTFTLTHSPNPVAGLQLFSNGLLMSPGVDYTLASQTVTFVNAPANGGTLVSWYQF